MTSMPGRLLFAVAALVASLLRLRAARAAATPEAAPPADAPVLGPGGCVEPVSTWSLSELVNQLLMVGGQFSDLGSSLPEAEAGVGGLVLFGRPAAGSGPAIRSGLSGLANAATRANRVVPWFSTDEEGGIVQRLANVAGRLPSARQMAAQWTPAQVEAQMATHGRAMRSLGLTMDLAPVLDVSSPDNVIAYEDERSFSNNPQVVASYGIAYEKGLRSGGVVPVAKHFPGLGHASADTDLAPATDPSLAQLQSDDLIPFERAVAAGVPVVMVGHPQVPGLTDGRPASLSAAACRYLKNNVHFSGVAMTDDLAAKAISDAGYSEPSAAVTAIEAGADMAMIDASAWPATVSALEQAVGSGALPLSRVEASVKRILAAKSALVCPTVTMAPGAKAGGYWIAGSGGAVRSFGSAGFYGSGA